MKKVIGVRLSKKEIELVKAAGGVKAVVLKGLNDEPVLKAIEDLEKKLFKRYVGHTGKGASVTDKTDCVKIDPGSLKGDFHVVPQTGEVIQNTPEADPFYKAGVKKIEKELGIERSNEIVGTVSNNNAAMDKVLASTPPADSVYGPTTIGTVEPKKTKGAEMIEDMFAAPAPVEQTCYHCKQKGINLKTKKLHGKTYHIHKACLAELQF